MTSWPFRVTPPLLAVVDSLTTADREMHGWELAEQAGQTPPNVYRALERLRLAGWVTYRWEDNPAPSKPRRRLYRLADDAHSNAETLLAERTPKP